jgi:hypothetical protein
MVSSCECRNEYNFMFVPHVCAVGYLLQCDACEKKIGL